MRATSTEPGFELIVRNLKLMLVIFTVYDYNDLSFILDFSILPFELKLRLNALCHTIFKKKAVPRKISYT